MAVFRRRSTTGTLDDEPNCDGGTATAGGQFEREEKEMKKEQALALSHLEQAFAKLASSGAKLRGQGTVLYVVGSGSKHKEVRYDLAVSDIYQEVESGMVDDAAVSPIRNFDDRQRRAATGLEKALRECVDAGLFLVSVQVGLLAIEKEKLALANGQQDLEDLQEEMLMLDDGGAWR